MRKNYMLVFLLFAGLMTTAQEKKNHNILFSSQQEQLRPILSQQLFLKGSKSIEGKFYRIIQFQNTLFPSDFENLKQMGIELLEYIPHHAYIASFPENFNVSSLSSSQVRTIVSLEPNWKLANNVFTGQIPEWANLGNGQMEAVVIPFPGVSMSQLTSDLERSGVRLTAIQVRGDVVDVKVAINDVEKLASLNSVKFIHAGEEPGQPENDGARRSARVSLLNSRYGIADRYDGAGVLISLGDDGDIGPHIDYQGRLVSVAGNSNGDHGDHVAGTIFGAGNRNPIGQGMAPGVDIRYYSYPGNLTNANSDYNAFNVRITSSSYSNGCNAGYTSFSRDLDLGTYTNDKLLHVFSAGNSGNSNCGYGAGTGWGNITGGHKVGKNVIAVANIQKSDAIAGSSSRGPAHDGRIKPEIGAVGTSVFSTTDPHIYTTKTGTSMSCPGVSGSLSLIYQAYKLMHNGVDPDAGLAKAILLNTADDLGNPGPDFIFGFGKMHVARAIDAVEDSTFIIDQLTTGQTKTHTVTVPPNTAQARVMLYWTDPPASVNASRALVNDLDLSVISNSVPYQPWVLDPTPVAANLNSNATRATDTLNNVEQVTIDNPTAGDLTISVTGNVNLGGTQKFYLVYTFVQEEIKVVFPAGGESLVPNEPSEVRWDAHTATGNFQVQFSINNGQNWTTIGTAPANARRIAWSIPNNTTGEALVRVTRGAITATSDFNFTIAGQPGGLELDYACPDSIGISWNPVQGATGYQIYVLGNKYMDSVAFSPTTNYVFFNQNPANEMWISVAALGPNGMKGRRAIAIFKPSGLTNCIVEKDLALNALISPAPGKFPDCQALTNSSITVELANTGTDTITSSPIWYRINNGTRVWDTLQSVMFPGDTASFVFSTPLSLVPGVNNVQIAAAMQDDGNGFNDTVETIFEIYNATTIASFPYTQNFQGMATCVNTNDCGADVCGLGLGWVNETNGVQDDIDWLVNTGTTPSAGTGPGQAFSPANGSGKYLFLEATTCFEQESRMLSPCFDLTNASVPEASFYYHMLGNNMGTLHVDILVDGEYELDVISPISGNQGNLWREQRIDLIDYIGKVVTFRFRAITGPDFESDIAIDAFSVEEISTPPVAAFNVNPEESCLNNPVLLQNETVNGQTFQWTISPSTFNLLNGTTLTDRNPVVEFTALGIYSVTLVATNANGTDTVIDATAVDVNSGLSLPVVEDFSAASFPPVNWSIENPDNAITWTLANNVTSSSGANTNAAALTCFTYNAAGEVDYLNLPILDLTVASAPFLVFDVAYARYSNTFFDSLEIEVSTDCGLSYSQVIYSKGGTSLATRSDLITGFSPSSASDWRTDTIDLDAFKGGSLRVRFKGINGYGNNMYINNVNLIDTAITAPTVTLGASATANVCPGDTVVYSAAVTGSAGIYSWNFGPVAVPQTATGPGPIEVIYLVGGTYNADITVVNSGGSATDQVTVEVDNNPSANFSSANNNTTTFVFTDLTTNNPTSWLWDFGDGTTSTLQNPTHTFAPGQNYIVTLTASNNCGPNSRQRNVNLESFSSDDWQPRALDEMVVRPNPSNGAFTISGISAGKADVVLRVTDLVGRVVYQDVKQFKMASDEQAIDLSNLSKGTYILNLDNGAGTRSVKLIIQ